MAALSNAACAREPQLDATAPVASAPVGSTVVRVTPSREDVVAKKLNEHAHDLLAQARKIGKPTVVLLVSTVADRMDEATTGLRQLGGTVDGADPRTGYLRVSLPTRAVERAAELPSVSAIDLDEIIVLDDPPP